MSYSLRVYFLPEGDLKWRTGRRDETASLGLINESGDEIADNARVFEDEINRGAPKLGQALKELMTGAVSQDQFGFQYGYALELICARFGKRVDSELFQEYRSPWMQDLEVFDECFYKLNLPVQMPKPANFPQIGYVSAAYAVELLGRMEGVDLMKTGCLKPQRPEGMLTRLFGKKGQALVDDEVVRGREEILGWLKRSADKQEEIVTFEY